MVVLIQHLHHHCSRVKPGRHISIPGVHRHHMSVHLLPIQPPGRRHLPGVRVHPEGIPGHSCRDHERWPLPSAGPVSGGDTGHEGPHSGPLADADRVQRPAEEAGVAADMLYGDAEAGCGPLRRLAVVGGGHVQKVVTLRAAGERTSDGEQTWGGGEG